VHILMLGAQSEATLPVAAWREVHLQHPSLRIALHMVGPDVPREAHNTVQYLPRVENQSSAESAMGSTSGMRIHRYHGRYHDLPPIACGLVVFFNSGIHSCFLVARRFAPRTTHAQCTHNKQGSASRAGRRKHIGSPH
jgi:hypothetical protein